MAPGLPSTDTARSLPIFLAGPTAVGKTSVALTLARQLNGEIISVDSMQVYRGMNIGTAKPTSEERSGIPHHLVDVADLTEPFDAARFCQLARIAHRAIEARGRLPIFCGGTGLYLKAYLEGLGPAPASDPSIRAQVEKTPMDELLRELEQKDPETYARIDQQNARRVVRAIEVIRLTGKPFGEQRAPWNATPEPHPNLFILNRDRSDLIQRIDQRVEEMFVQGLVDETRHLLECGLAQNPTALQAIGYRQVVEYLEQIRSLEATIDLVKVRTRQFAKRQITWFRGQMRGRWLSLSPSQPAGTVAKQILEMMRDQERG